MRYGLSIDAGGIRGVAALVFLIEFMQDRKRVDPNFNISSFFDVFAGSSVGGLLCIIMCINPTALHTDVSVILHDVVHMMFTGRPAWLGSVFAPRYTQEGFRDLFHKYAPNSSLQQVHARGKRLVVPVYNVSDHAPFVFDSAQITGEDNDVGLLDLALATCAFPGIFPAHPIRRSYYIDGGFVQTNPVMLAAADVKCADVKFISIGAGVKYTPLTGESMRTWGTFQWLKSGVLEYMGDPRVTDMIAHAVLQDRYLRINTLLPGIGEMDDVTSPNITRLIKLGKSWYWDNKAAIWSFVGFVPSPPHPQQQTDRAASADI